MDGLLGLFGSKKGITFGGVAAVLIYMLLQGSIPAPLGAELLVVLASAHFIGQGIADHGSKKPNNTP